MILHHSRLTFVSTERGVAAHVMQIQAAVRMRSARAAYQRQRAAAAVVQAAARALAAGRGARAALAQRRAAAVVVQAAWRGTLQRRSYLAARAAVVQVSALHVGCDNRLGNAAWR